MSTLNSEIVQHAQERTFVTRGHAVRTESPNTDTAQRRGALVTQ